MTVMIIYDNKGPLKFNQFLGEELLKCVMHFQVFCGTIFFRKKLKFRFFSLRECELNNKTEESLGSDGVFLIFIGVVSLSFSDAKACPGLDWTWSHFLLNIDIIKPKRQ